MNLKKVVLAIVLFCTSLLSHSYDYIFSRSQLLHPPYFYEEGETLSFNENQSLLHFRGATYKCIEPHPKAISEYISNSFSYEIDAIKSCNGELFVFFNKYRELEIPGIATFQFVPRFKSTL